MSGGERVCLHRNGVSAHPWSQTFGKSGDGFQSYESSLGELWLVHRRVWERSNLYSIHYTVFTHACICIQKRYVYIYIGYIQITVYIRSLVDPHNLKLYSTPLMNLIQSQSPLEASCGTRLLLEDNAISSHVIARHLEGLKCVPQSEVDWEANFGGSNP